LSKNYDICSSAALAFHKALIGIAQLDSLERAAGKGLPYGSFRNSRAIQAYYVVYHLFTMVMLLSDEYEPITPKEYGNVKKSELNSPSELPEQWNRQRGLESDYATIIQHFHIKNFCNTVRGLKKENLNPLLQILYSLFIQPPQNEQERCIPGMYEKVCYVRDRAIYRPSNVISDEKVKIQTSLDIRKEIDSLPDSKQLYSILCQLYDKMLELSLELSLEEHKDNVEYIRSTLFFIWNSPVNCTVDYLKEIGLSSEQIDTLMELKYDNDEKPSFRSYICHLIELEDPDYIKEAVNKWWEPLEKEFNKTLDKWWNDREKRK